MYLSFCWLRVFSLLSSVFHSLRSLVYFMYTFPDALTYKNKKKATIVGKNYDKKAVKNVRRTSGEREKEPKREEEEETKTDV